MATIVSAECHFPLLYPVSQDVMVFTLDVAMWRASEIPGNKSLGMNQCCMHSWVGPLLLRRLVC